MVSTVGTPMLYGIFIFFILSMLIIDLKLQGKNSSTELTLRQSVIWSLAWVMIALLFNMLFWLYLRNFYDAKFAQEQALAFTAGYLVEKALAIDNVFVWIMLFKSFSISASNTQRLILFYGVAGAIILRSLMIFVGSWLIANFNWILAWFGLFLIWIGVKTIIKGKGSEENSASVNLLTWLQKHLKITKHLEGNRFFVRKTGVLYATPLFIVLLLVEFSDVLFAIDSIPAIFALTTDPFIVLSSNMFAILGLRAMFFLLAHITKQFAMLVYALGLILIFVGFKMLLIKYIHIPTTLSLSIIILILTVTCIINSVYNKKMEKKR